MPWWLDQAPGMTTISHLGGVWRHVPPGKFEMFDPQGLSAYTAIHNTMLHDPSTIQLIIEFQNVFNIILYT